MGSFLRTILGAVVAFAFAAPAMASPITYTEMGTGSGSLDGHSFTNLLVTITMTADTSNITQPTPGFFQNLGTTSVTVSTVGTDTLTHPFVFVNQTFPAALGGPAAGFRQFDSGRINYGYIQWRLRQLRAPRNWSHFWSVFH